MKGRNMGMLVAFAGALVSFACFIWLAVIAFQTDHWIHGVGIIVFPCYAIVYSIMHWDECSTPFFGWFLGSVVYFAGSNLAVMGMRV